MKIILKIQIITLLVLFSSFMLLSASADDTYTGSEEISFSELCVVSDDEFEINLKPLKSVSFYSYNGTVASVNFSEQLSGNSLSVYENLKQMDSDTKSLSILLKTPVTFVSKTTSPTETELKPVYTEIKRFTQMAIDAYGRDYPENFWLDIEKSVYSFNYFGKEVNGQYQWSISILTYKPAIKSEYSASISAHDYRFEKTVEIFEVSGNSTYEKVKSIYKQICEDTVYRNQTHCYDAYGPLISGYAVCSGYAKAFKVICDRENIPCVLVSGIGVDNKGQRNSHMWNLVKMDDGKWYCVDVTWADSGNLTYDYLLTGTKVKLSSLNNKTFAETHLATGDFSGTGYFEFKYPEASKTAFDPNWTPPTATPKPTATPIPTATPVPVENPEMGDANRSGVITADDALIVLKVSAKLLDNSDGYFNYGDMQNDGILTAEDALLILKHCAKIS